MGHLLCHRLGRAHVAENDDCSSSLSLPVMDGSHTVLDRNFKSIPPDENAVWRQMYDSVLLNRYLHWIRCSFAAWAAENSEHFANGFARRFLPRPPGHF